MSKPHVLQIEAGLRADRTLIGGKASSLVRLLDLGAAVPPAFVLTTEAYRDWAANPSDDLLNELLGQGVKGLEARTGRRLAGGNGGLIVSVRSGAQISMPGMMDTVLNVGFGPLAAGAEQFIYDARTRFLWQFAELVLGLDAAWLEALRRGLQTPDATSTAALEASMVAEARQRGQYWPASPFEELEGAARAVFASWESGRAKLYRRLRKIDDSVGTTVTVQQMVFGNRDAESGSGVAFTRDPTTGADGLTGEFLFGGQGEEIVSGRETAAGLQDWHRRQPRQFQQLESLGKRLEQATKRVHEIEFTVERGAFYLLQCRPALLTARAAARVAVNMCVEGRLSRSEAVAYARSHGFDPTTNGRGLSVVPGIQPVASGLPVGGGVAIGRVAFGSAKIQEIERAGDPAVLVTFETSPKSLPLMQRCAALVTMRGGATSHAAVVARELGTTCVVGVGGDIDGDAAGLGAQIREGDWITVDGDTGAVYPGNAAIVAETMSAEERQLRDWAEHHSIEKKSL
jgi:pyruvate, orthophosphate dikinase